MDNSNITNPTNRDETGFLNINITSLLGSNPIDDATIEISTTGEPDRVIEKISTNEIGQTENIALETPPLEYSLEPTEFQPYAEYNLKITANNYYPVFISGTQLLPTVTAIQNVTMNPVEETNEGYPYVIGPHTLYGYYPPKIAEEAIKPVDESGEIVLSQVVVPEYIVVHDGVPTDQTAQNYYVRYRDYIKNVASSEIYATCVAYQNSQI